MIGLFAAISAAIAVAAGAFGAHGAAGPQQAEWLRTGGLYQLIHAVAALAIMGFARGPAITLLVGAAIFFICRTHCRFHFRSITSTSLRFGSCNYSRPRIK